MSSTNAQNIARILLEDDNANLRPACGACEREFGVHDPQGSHGNCKRHTLAQYQDMLSYAKTPERRSEITQKMRAIIARPDSDFPPDLSKPENQQYRDSLQKSDFEAVRRTQQAYMDRVHQMRGEDPLPV